MDGERQWVVDNMYMVDRVIRRHFPSLYGDMLEEARAVGMAAMWEHRSTYTEGKGCSEVTWLQDHIKWAINRWLPQDLYGFSQSVYYRLREEGSIPDYIHYDQMEGPEGDDNWYLDTVVQEDRDPLKVLLDKERLELFNAGLSLLGHLERRALMGYTFDAKTYKELALELNNTEVNMQTSAQRGRDKLKRFIQEVYT